MIALDTNVLVRLVTGDDAKQTEAAAAALETERVWVAKTVLLETEWVLRYSYELDRSVIEQTFLQLLGLEQLEVEDRPAVLAALSAYAQGVDFADALHVAPGREARSFVTFDRKLARLADRLELVPEVQVLGGE